LAAFTGAGAVETGGIGFVKTADLLGYAGAFTGFGKAGG